MGEKRPGNRFFPKPTSSIKKPRLDISSNHVTCNHRQTGPGSSTTNACSKDRNTEIKVTSNIVVSQGGNDIWDDDDGDEYIFLASQAFEADLHSEKILNTSHNSQVNYGRFSEEVQSSTQFGSDRNDQYTELKGVDLQELDNADNFFSKYADQVYKDLEKIKQDERKPLETRAILQSIAGPSRIPSQPLAIEKSQKQEANKRLLNNLETMKKDHDKLQADYTNLNDQLLSKEGEVSVLRYEIKQMKQHHDALRLEKIQEDNNQKKAFLDKIADLEKSVKIHKMELELKKLEISKVKSKHLNDTQKLENERDHEVLAQCERELQIMKEQYFIELPGVSLKLRATIPNIHPEIFIETIKEKRPDPDQIKLLKYLKKFQSILSRLQSVADASFIDTIEDELLELTKLSLHVLLNCTRRLKFSKYQDYHEFLSMQKDKSFDTGNIFQADKLFATEKQVIARRIIAALSIICCCSRNFTSVFFNSEITFENIRCDGEEIRSSCYGLLSQIINDISFSFDFDEHMGVITASAHLLNSTGRHYWNDPSPPDVLFDFLKLVIFARPTINGLLEISEFLSKIRSPSFLNKICTPSLKHKPVETVYKSNFIYFFGSESCVLQVYTALLEIVFPQHVTLSQSKIEMLTRLTLQTFDLLHYVHQVSLDWMAQQTVECECHNRLNVGAIILLHLVMQHWVNDADTVNIRYMSVIVRSGVIVLHNILKMKYRRSILQTGGFAISQRLQIIYNWVQEHKPFYSFSSPQAKAFAAIDMGYIINDALTKSSIVEKRKDCPAIKEIVDNVYDNFFKL